MKELVAQIKEQIAAFTENADLQVEKNNKAAGTRARKAAEGFPQGVGGRG